MKKVAIVALNVALKNEKGYTRFAYLSKLLSNYYQVDLITSTFQHWEKKQRDISKINENEYPFNILFAEEPGYRKNIDVKRIISHKLVEDHVMNIIRSNNYALIYCSIPGNNMAAQVVKYGTQNGIKTIIDVEDLWPEAMQMVFHFPKFVDNVIYYPFRRTAREAYSKVDGIIGTSDEYRDASEKIYGIHKDNKETVYVGCDFQDFDDGVKEYSSAIQKEENEFWLVYAGTLGSSYDIPTLISAAQDIYSRGIKNIKIKILGSGPLENDFKKIAEQKPCNVEFLGYTPYRKMAAYLSKSDVTINSFVKSAPQSIVNKIGDYLAAGKPMINTCSSKEFRNKVDADGFGINVEAEKKDVLVDAILKFYYNRDLCVEMGKKARRIADSEFDRKTSYLNILHMIENLIGK